MYIYILYIVNNVCIIYGVRNPYTVSPVRKYFNMYVLCASPRISIHIATSCRYIIYIDTLHSCILEVIVESSLYIKVYVPNSRAVLTHVYI